MHRFHEGEEIAFFGKDDWHVSLAALVEGIANCVCQQLRCMLDHAESWTEYAPYSHLSCLSNQASESGVCLGCCQLMFCSRRDGHTLVSVRRALLGLLSEDCARFLGQQTTTACRAHLASSIPSYIQADSGTSSAGRVPRGSLRTWGPSEVAS